MEELEERVDTEPSYETILRLQIKEGLQELQRPASGQFLSALACGLNLAIGVFGLFVTASAFSPIFPAPLTQVFKGIVYTFGFVFAILGQTELFTEHTSLALLPVLDGRASLLELGQLWSLVFVGNIIGSGIFAVLGFYTGLSLDLIKLQTFIEVAHTFIDLSPMGVFLGAILAGWLMALLAWILTSVGDTISRLVVIIFTTFLIGFAHLPHCVAANTELIAGIMAGADITWIQWARFEAITTLGNIVGGTVFVGLLNYSFAVRGTDEIDVEEEI